MTQGASIIISKSQEVDVTLKPAEIVERKGFGHPDTITDMLGAIISSNYSHYTKKYFGQILHHNIDKITLTGGRASVTYGDGQIIEPIQVDFVGRAVRDMFEAGKNRLIGIPIYMLGKNASDRVFQTLNERIEYKINTNNVKRGSDDLISNFGAADDVPLANDTSFATAWAPLSPLEKLVLEVEDFLNDQFRREHKALGTDIKVMGRRRKNDFILTIAAAFIAPELTGSQEYRHEKETLHETVAERFGIPKESVFVNMADDYEQDIEYITVTGTSAEQGDDGQIGRGNRVLGVIAPFRPQTLEAVAGKNPSHHVGNFYNVWASIIAKRIHEELGLKNNVVLVSTIGQPITDLDAIITIEDGNAEKEQAIRIIVDEVTQDYKAITQRIISFDFDDLYPFNLIKKYLPM